MGQKNEVVIRMVNDSGLADKLAMICLETHVISTNDLIDIRTKNEIGDSK